MRHLPVIALAATASLGIADRAVAASDPLKVTLASPAKGSQPPAFAGTRLTVGRPATATRTTLTLPAGTATLGATSSAPLGGSLILRAGTRRATVTGLRLAVTGKGLKLTGRTGGSTVTVLESRTGTAVATGATELRLRRAALKLTSAGAARLGRQLQRRIKAGATLGVVSGTLRSTAASPTAPAASTSTPVPSTVTPTTPSADPTTTPGTPTPPPVTPPTPPPFSGPFADACLAETAFGALTGGDVGVPTLASGAAATAATLTWNLRPSFVDYVDGGGRVAVWNGASRVAGGGFAFTFVSATTSDAGTPGTPADDYTVAQFRGRIDFCYPTHFFRIALADPIVVIDGGPPRIILTGDSLQGVPPTPATQIPARRVEFATFANPGATLAGGTLTWTVPASPGTKLTAAGADIANATSSPGSGLWGADLPFGGFTLGVTS